MVCKYRGVLHCAACAILGAALKLINQGNVDRQLAMAVEVESEVLARQKREVRQYIAMAIGHWAG
jgi:hypothetical protein